ncbi:hypothetical protein [Desulfatitalea alkaliphila]|uniref:Uncharacterized protein n=1 Tax=Desulfatitalea alkaliphila TaxID=2929485 RepID=A0AA41UKI1_9BACT|nr:hypothetical protein [Desulfatitalea alkaliphila]MCJ8501462.1 hypothetical protein [Desulfatitalea alkaliphila]
MKTLILDIQKDLFESSVLEQSAEIQFVSVDEVLGVKGVPCVLLGSKGIDDFTGTVRKLARANYQNGTGLIIINPPIDTDIGNAVDAPVSITVKKRKASSFCKPSGFDGLDGESKYEIWSDGTIESSLSSGVMGVDDNKGTVLLKYQPKNTSGAVFITTLKLLSYSGMTNEADRESLLKLLLIWENKQSFVNEEPTEDVTASDESVLHTVAILSFSYDSKDPDKISAAMSRFFTLNTDVDAVRQVLEQLSINLNATKENWKSKLEDYIDQAGHYSYAREIKEILEDEEAGV